MTRAFLASPVIESEDIEAVKSKLDDCVKILQDCNNSVDEIINQIERLPYNSEKREKLLGRLNTIIAKFNTTRKHRKVLEVKLHTLQEQQII